MSWLQRLPPHGRLLSCYHALVEAASSFGPRKIIKQFAALCEERIKKQWQNTIWRYHCNVVSVLGHCLVEMKNHRCVNNRVGCCSVGCRGGSPLARWVVHEMCSIYFLVRPQEAKISAPLLKYEKKSIRRASEVQPRKVGDGNDTSPICYRVDVNTNLRKT